MRLGRAISIASVLFAGSVVHSAVLNIVVERRFPVNVYCPVDNDDFNLTFVAEGPYMRLSFTMDNFGPSGTWLHRRLDNIGVVAKSVYDAHKLVTPGFDICYSSPGHDNTPGYDFSAAGTPEIYLNLFDTNADGWDLNRGAYFEPGPNVSAPRNPPVGNDRSGGALGMGKEADGPVSITTSVLVSGLTAGVQYIVTGWWWIEDELRPMTVTIDTSPCLDRDADGVVECADCDDRNPKRKPGLAEVCDGVDNDCDGLVDESTPCDRVCGAPSNLPSELRVTNAEFLSQHPSLAWNGTDFAMVYKDSRNGGQDLFFSRAGVTGAKIGTDVNLTPLGGTNERPRMVWTGSEYGVVWDEGGIGAFRRFDRNGAPIGSITHFGDNFSASMAPDLVWTGTEYGVVWIEHVTSPEVYFARIDPTGALSLVPTPLSAASSPSEPRIAWNGTHYGVVWQDFGSTQTIMFRRVAPLDVKAGSPLELTPSLSGSITPAIAAGGVEFGIAWSDFRNGETEIYFTRVNAAGNEVIADARVTSSAGASVGPSIAWTGAEWGIAYEDTRLGNGSEQWFSRMSSVGAKLGSDFRVTTVDGTSRQASLVWAGGKLGLAWNDDRNDGDQEIYFGRVGCDCVDGDLDTRSSCIDCDDGRAATFPGASQVCDGFNNDCNDVNWPLLTGTNELDGDGDTFTGCTGDCNDANANVWATPGEARFVLMSHDKLNSVTNVSWSAPVAPGGSSLLYDTVRSNTASNFVTGATCVETNNGPNTVSTDTANPAPGAYFAYLIRAENACPSGQGPLGNASNGTPRTARTCP